jgi:hypothetical protein
MSQHALVLCGDYSVDWKDVAATLSLDQGLCPQTSIQRPGNTGASHRSGVYNGENLEYFWQTLKTKGELDFEDNAYTRTGLRSYRSS